MSHARETPKLGEERTFPRAPSQPPLPPRRRRFGAAAAWLLCLLAAACRDASEPEVERSGAAPSRAAKLAAGTTDSSSWVALYDPQRAANGYTLAFYRQRVPIVFDMNGRIVHAWPEVRAKSRARLLGDGSLLTIDLGRSVSRWSWDGELLWRWRGAPGQLPHHDFRRLANGRTLIVIRTKGKPTDELIEVDDAGEIVWRWDAAEHLAAYLDRASKRQQHDLTHINSVQELPANRHADAGDERFRPGNLLLSARNLNTIFIIDRTTGRVVWEYAGELDYQHEALMLAPDRPGAGNIQIFDNGYRGRYRYRSSEVREIDPASGDTVWSYTDPTFFSATSALEQPLANGNVLIASSRGGRVFEVTRDGDLVWQWTPPYQPRRPHRLAYDHCPQLAALPRPDERTVRPPPGYRHVDRGVYRFARRGQLRRVEVGGVTRRVLRDPQLCVPMVPPRGAEVALSYGLDAARPGADRNGAVRFALRSERGGETTELWHDTIDPGTGDTQTLWRSATVDLADDALQPITLCVTTDAVAGGSPPASYALWENPHVAPRGGHGTIEGEADDDLKADELDVQLEHLKALGYID